VRFLEAGCGAGANVWYLAREGFMVTGIDGSAAAIQRAHQYLAEDNLTADLRVGDLLEVLPRLSAASFDCVVDVGCFQCHRLADVRRLVDESTRVLKGGGRLFSLVHARGSEGDGKGRELEPGTFTDIESGQLQGLGVNHFFSEAEVRELLGAFVDVTIDRLTHTRYDQAERYAHLLATGRKPSSGSGIDRLSP
jgi:SAM-dependent methyltransferase